MSEIATLLAVDEEAWSVLRGVVADLNDEQIFVNAPAIDERTIAGVTVHAYASIFYMAFPLAGHDWPSPPAEPTSATELLTVLDSMHEQVKNLLAVMPEGALEKMYDMPWGVQWSGRQSIVGALSHAFVHAGAIQGIRALAGFPTPPEK